MTISDAKTKLVNWLTEQVGYHEGANNYNKYADIWSKAGGWNAQNQPWCDIFADVAYIEVFGLENAAKLTYQKVGSFSALCSASARFYKENGAWTQSPEVGDQIFFNVGGAINHTGIVVSVSGGVVNTVEGNSSDAVRKNAYAIGSSYINGYGRPDWSVVVNEDGGDPEPAPEPAPAPAPEPAKEMCKVELSLPLIKYGDEGAAVKLMQLLLIHLHGCYCGWYGADGEYGDGTKLGLIKFQHNNGLEQDGECGEATWTKLLEV